MEAVLWHIRISHYNEKARWALDYKRVPHVRRTPLPGFHGFHALALTRGKQRRLPVLKLDGRRIGDSTAIIAALEQRFPEPPLYPADPELRRRALDLEEFFDEELAPALRLYVWHHTLPDVNATIESLIPEASERRKRAVRRVFPLMRPIARRDYGASDDAAPRALQAIHAAMDRVESELQPSGYLVDDAFTVADLAAAALFTPVLSPPERPYSPSTLAPALVDLRGELEARPGGEWVREMYARHRPPSSEVGATPPSPRSPSP